MPRLHKIALVEGGEAHIDPKLIIATYRAEGENNWTIILTDTDEFVVDGAVHAYLLQHANA